MAYHRGGFNSPVKGIVWAELVINSPEDPVPPYRMLIRHSTNGGMSVDSLGIEVPMTAINAYTYRAEWTIPDSLKQMGGAVDYELVDTGEWTGNRMHMGFGFIEPESSPQADGSLRDTQVFVDTYLSEFGVVSANSQARGVVVTVHLNEEQAIVATDPANRPRLRITKIVNGVGSEVMFEPMQLIWAPLHRYRGWWQIPDSLYLESDVQLSYDVFYEQGGNPVLSGVSPLKTKSLTPAELDSAVATAVAAATAPLTANILTLQTANATLTGQNTTLTNQIATLNGQIGSLTLARDALQVQVATLANNNTSLQAINLALNTSVNERTTMIGVLNASIAALNGTIAALDARIEELEATATIVGFVPALRAGMYTIKDFSVFNGIQLTPSNNFYKYDIDFINVQLLSMKQGATKMRRIAAIPVDKFSMQFRPQWAKDTEFTAKKAGGFNDCLNECARIIEFAVNEIRNNQKFDLANVQFNRTIV